jgi:hypothetical protein
MNPNEPKDRNFCIIPNRLKERNCPVDQRIETAACYLMMKDRNCYMLLDGPRIDLMHAALGAKG